MPDLPEVVLIEDNPDDEKLVARALSRSKMEHRLTVLRDGEEATNWLDALTEQSDGRLPSLVLMDNKMPKKTGMEILQRIRSDPRLAAMPIVMMSHAADPRGAGEYFRFGANSVINKGVDWEAVIHDLTLTMEYWLGVNQTGILT